MKNFICAIAAIASAAVISSCGSNNSDIEGVKTIKTDDMEVTWIRDNAGPRLMERSLFPDAPDSLITALGLDDGIPASMSAFLVKKDGNLLLFDTGLGSTESRLPTALAAMGISADEVDCIFLTHLHGDHIGGMLKDGKAAFPNAEVYVSKTEYDMDKPAAAESRIRILGYARKNGLTMGGMHFPEPAFLSLTEE